MNIHPSIKKISSIHIGTGLCILFAIALWLYGINDPYVGSYNANNNYLTLAAKNYLRFGVGTLSTLPTYFAGYPLPSRPEFYLHHPYFFFLVNTIAFYMFGFSNWVVHVFPFLFSLGTVAVTYLLVRRVFGVRIGVLFACISLCLPASVLFWKFMMFEQSSLFFVMTTMYVYIRYRETGKTRYLWYGGITSFLAASFDWYGAYAVFAFIVALLWNKKTRTRRFFLVYVVGVCIALFGFLAIIFVVKGNFADIWSAVSVRAVSNELFALSWWPVRYAILLGIRSIVYFSPLILLPILRRSKLPGPSQSVFSDERTLVYILFGSIGILNCIVLPTATWGHSYFLYPFIPYVALALAVPISRYRVKIQMICIVALVLWSALVQKGKYEQIHTLYWKFDAAKTVAARIRPYEPVGTVDFPGDVFEQYFLHPSVPMELPDVALWIQGKTHREVRTVVISCYGACPGNRNDVINRYRKSGIPFYTLGSGNRAFWVFSKQDSKQYTIPDERKNSDGNVQKDSGIWYIRMYRVIRNILGVVQI